MKRPPHNSPEVRHHQPVDRQCRAPRPCPVEQEYGEQGQGDDVETSAAG